MLTENLNGGVASWANPHPNSCTFLYPIDPGATAANFAAPPADLTNVVPGPFINQLKSGAPGQAPFPSSLHPGGVNFANCEGGARFVSEDIDRSVYTRLITPSGTRLRSDLTGIGFVPESPLGSNAF